MNAQLNKVLVALSAASLCFMAVGCGEMPENPDDIMVYGEEGVTSPEVNYPTVDGVGTDDFARGPVLEENFVDPSSAIHEGVDLEDAYDDAKTPRWEDRAEISDLGEDAAGDEDEATRPAGFADGCATRAEWKRLAKVVCTSLGEDAELAAFKTGQACGQQQYRLTRFGCSVDMGDDNEPQYNKFSSLLLGGEGSCKTMATYLNYAATVCGDDTKVIEAKALKNCDGDDNSSYYESVRVTCIDR